MNDGCAEYLTGNAHHNDGRFSYVLFMGNHIFQEGIYMSKTIRELSKTNGRVYVYLRTPELGERFLRQAEQEGFTFGDGEKPTARQYAEVMAVNRDGNRFWKRRNTNWWRNTDQNQLRNVYP